MSKLNEEHWLYFQGKVANSLSASRQSISEANQSERDLNSQLILVSTVIIGVSGAILAGGIFNDSATLEQGLAAFVAIVSALISIIFGIVYYFVIIKFNEDWTMLHRDIALGYDKVSATAVSGDKESYKSALSEVEALQKKLPEKTKRSWVYAEIVALFAAFMGLIALVSAIMFNWRPIFATLF